MLRPGQRVDFGENPGIFGSTPDIQLRLTVFDVLGKSLLEKVADVTNNAKQCLWVFQEIRLGCPLKEVVFLESSEGFHIPSPGCLGYIGDEILPSYGGITPWKN